MKMNKRSVPGLIHQASGIVDYGSPPEIVNCARLVMGGIDLDPASAPYYNRMVQAKRYFHLFRVNRWVDGRKDPLLISWRNLDGSPSKVWMNHPYGRKENVAWVEKMITEYQKGSVAEACVLTFAEQSTRWGKQLRAFPRWIPDQRLAHYDPQGNRIPGSVKGSMVTYIGPFKKWGTFHETFVSFLGGSVDIPAGFHYKSIEWFARENARARLGIQNDELFEGEIPERVREELRLYSFEDFVRDLIEEEKEWIALFERLRKKQEKHGPDSSKVRKALKKSRGW